MHISPHFTKVRVLTAEVIGKIVIK